MTIIEFIRKNPKISALVITTIFVILSIGLYIYFNTSTAPVIPTEPEVIPTEPDVPVTKDSIFISTEKSILRSDDIKNWREYNLSKLITPIFSICSNSDNSLFVAVGGSISSNIIYSLNGNQWFSSGIYNEMGFGIGVGLCAFYSKILGKFIIGGKNSISQLATSSDGINWKYIDNNDTNIINDIDLSLSISSVRAVAESSNIIVAIGGKKWECNILWSVNGEIWNVAKIATNSTSSMVLLSKKSTDLDYNPSCISYSESLELFVAGCIFYGGVFDSTFFTSKDGKSWDNIKINLEHLYIPYGMIVSIVSVYAICWSPELQLFVASIEGLIPSRKNLYCLLFSKDAITWTVTKFQFEDIKINSIYWSENLSKFVATGSNDVVAYTDDGLTWSYLKFGNLNKMGLSITGI